MKAEDQSCALSCFRLAGAATAQASASGFDMSRLDLWSRRVSKPGSAEQSQKPMFETGKPKPRKTLEKPKLKSEVKVASRKQSSLALLRTSVCWSYSVLGQLVPKQKGGV